MSLSTTEKEVTDAINHFQERDTERLLDYQRAIERYSNLESKGLLRKRGNSLLPIEERYKLTLEYRNRNSK